jgi:hypothetical protein
MMRTLHLSPTREMMSLTSRHWPGMKGWLGFIEVPQSQKSAFLRTKSQSLI